MGNAFMHLLHQGDDLFFGVAAMHRFEHLGRSALNRQMHRRTHLIAGRDGVNHLVCHVLGVTGHETDPFEPFDGIHIPQQIGKAVTILAVVAIGIHILPQRDRKSVV